MLEIISESWYIWEPYEQKLFRKRYEINSIANPCVTCESCSDWEWAERDGKRLVWATEGKLFCGNIGPSGLTDETELFDFNPMVFEPIEAPY